MNITVGANGSMVRGRGAPGMFTTLGDMLLLRTTSTCTIRACGALSMFVAHSYISLILVRNFMVHYH